MQETKQQFFVTLSDGQFWERVTDHSTNAEWDEPLDVAKMDRLANGYRWIMDVQGPEQRKLPIHYSTASLFVMLLDVRKWLKEIPGAQVKCMTPDIEIIFENA